MQNNSECAEKALEKNKSVAECGEGAAWRRVRSTPVTRPRVGLEVLSKSCTDLKGNGVMANGCRAILSGTGASVLYMYELQDMIGRIFELAQTYNFCGTRAELKLRLEKCASTLSPICEHHDEKDEDQNDEQQGLETEKKNGGKEELLQMDTQESKTSSYQVTRTDSPSNLISFEMDLAQPLLPRGAGTPGASLNLGPFQGDVEIAVRTESRLDLFALTVSPPNLNAPPLITRTALTPTIALTQKFQLQLDNSSAYLTPLDQHELAVLTSRCTQTVVEVERGSQVGGSLVELNETESENFFPTAIEPIQEGLVYSYHALKYLIQPLFQNYGDGTDPETAVPLLAGLTEENTSDESSGLPTTTDSLAIIDQLLLYVDL